MLCLEWSASLSVFVPEMDDEHKEIFEALARFESALARPAPSGEIRRLAGALTDRIEGHFAHEERLMRAARYVSYRWHKRQHDAARRQAGRLRGKLGAGEAAAGPELAAYVGSWLDTHTRVSDMMLAAFLRNHRRGLHKMTFRAGTRPADSCEWVDSRGERFDPASS